MDKNKLLELEKALDISPNELKEKNPELYSKIKTNLTGQLKNYLEENFKNSPEIKNSIKKIDMGPVIDGEKDVQTVLQDAIKSEDNPPAKNGIQRAFDNAFKSANNSSAKKQEETLNLGNLPSLINQFDPNVALKDQPLLQSDIQKAKVYILGDIINLPPEKADEIAKNPVINNTELSSLVKNGSLTESEAKDLGLTSSIYNLVDENGDLTGSVKKGSFGKLDNHQVSDLRDLAAFSTDDWLNIIKEAKITPPKGVTAESYANILVNRVAVLYPTDVFMSLLKPLESSDITSKIGSLQPLIKINDNVFSSSSFDNLNTSDLDKTLIPNFKDVYTQLKNFANSYPGLGINNVLDDKTLSDTDKSAEITRRVKLLDTLKNQNTGVEFLKLDYSPDSEDISKLNFTGLNDDDKKMVLSTWKAYQRVDNISNDVNDSRKILASGYHSASSITNVSYNTFRDSTGLDEEPARASYSKASDIIGIAAANAGTIIDAVYGGLNNLKVGNIQSNDIQEYLLKMDGFSDLFGSQAYCNCKDCQSIMSPAAYFVDLMGYIDKNVLQIYFTGNNESHPLNLKTRRPDLWTLELTCENTNNEIPTLEIINEILEHYISKLMQKTHVDHVINPPEFKPIIPNMPIDLTEILDYDVYPEFANLGSNQSHNQLNSFRLPFNLPLLNLQVYLSYLQKTRGEIARAFGFDLNNIDSAVELVCASLDISDVEYNLITTPNTDPVFLSNLYDTQKIDSADYKFEHLPDGTIKPFDVQFFLKSTGLTRSELDDLVFTLSKLFNFNVQINSDKKSSDSIQNDVEYIQGLNYNILDIIHRFLRLWYKLTWSMGELGLLLSHLNEITQNTNPADPSKIDFNILKAIVDIQYIQDNLGLSVEEACGLWSNIPQEKISNNKLSFFDSLFNLTSQPNDEFPPTDSSFTLPALINNPLSTDNVNLNRLLIGLNVTTDELYQLVINLKDALGLKLNQPDPNNNVISFDINLQNITLLYRHAVAAKKLKLTIPDLFKLINYFTINTYITNSSDVITLIEGNNWLNDSEYTLNDVVYIISGKSPESDAYPDSQTIANEIISYVQSQKTLEFADTVFALLTGITENISREIININVAAYRLTSSYDIANLIIPSDIDQTKYPNLKTEVEDILNKIQSQKTLEFTDTVFVSEEITEDMSHEIINANISSSTNSTPIIEKIPEIIEKVDNIYRLASSFNVDNLVIPSDIDQTQYPDLKTEIIDLLKKYHASEIIPNLLSAELKISVTKTNDLIKLLTGVDLFDQLYSDALKGDITALQSLENLVSSIIPLKILFKSDMYDPDTEQDIDPSAINFIETNQTIFNITDFSKITLENIKSISIYNYFAEASQQDKFSTTKPGFTPLDVRNILIHMNNLNSQGGQQTLTDDDITLLTPILNAEKDLVKTLLNSKSLTGNPLKDLQLLSQRSKLAQYLNINGDMLELVISNTYNELQQASDAIISGLRIKYPDDDEWNEKIGPYEDKIRSSKRNALVEYLTRSLDYPEFTTTNDIYDYLLIDVEIEGCTTTSPLVAAISSLQLYVYRILMNLEQSADGKVNVQISDDVVGQWAWRQNYRVWEANRKVFLYPENYIEPELRHDKTPLFKDLETKLLQQEINEQNVLDAYANYMNGFVEVAKLKIAGAYHDIKDDPKADKLHLFGVTPGDPPIYYYRTVDNLHWGEVDPQHFLTVWHPWQKIDVQISVRKVEPIVFNKRLYVFWLEVVTKPYNSDISISGGSGGSQFMGYKHKLAWKYTYLRLDGKWSPPQEISMNKNLYLSSISDPLNDPTNNPVPLYDNTNHTEPREGYTLPDCFKQIYPFISYKSKYLCLNYPSITGSKNDSHYGVFMIGISLYENTPLPSSSFSYTIENSSNNLLVANDEANGRDLKLQTGTNCNITDLNVLSYYSRSFYLDEDIIKNIENINIVFPLNSGLKIQDLITKLDNCFESIAKYKDINTKLSVINGSVQDVISDSSGDLLLIKNLKQWIPGQHFSVKRIGTTLGDDIADKLFSEDINSLLAINNQLNLKEHENPINILNFYDESEDDDFYYIKNNVNEGILDFNGPYGIYYWEIFFHIPFLIASHLNSRQKFDSAQLWYQYIFNPTASADLNPKLCNKEDRNWQYIKFRCQGLPKLRDILNNGQAIAKYKNDPFNPFAIADLRISAYQKCIVMKYIDNLLDWGDSLFTEFTTESVNEATLLYIMAAEILGDRPADIGDCGEGNIKPKNYKNIAHLVQESEIFPELETLYFGSTTEKSQKNNISKVKTSIPNLIVDPSLIGSAIKKTNSNILENTENQSPIESIFKGNEWTKTQIRSWFSSKTDLHGKTNYLSLISHGNPLIGDFNSVSEIGCSIINQISPVFCIPANDNLLSYWDRVDDRLYKIRHCMDINGVARKLALFAPEIDPMLLVKAAAAGLSIEDVLNSTSGNLPPYRFTYLIEKAKSYAGTLQQFGGALLSALEKQDVEHLNSLRTVHEQNLQKLTTQIKQWEIDAEDQTIQSIEKKIDGVNDRKNHYQSLKDIGLIPWEVTEEVSRDVVSSVRITEATLAILAGVTHLIPDLGSPFALKYGGKEIGDSVSRFSAAMGGTAGLAEAIAEAAGRQASHQRREEEWDFQIKTATDELNELNKQLTAANIRKEIAEQSLTIHQKSIDQTEEIYDFYGDKFSNEGLYIWLSTQLQRLYRDAYNGAYEMAKLAEKAYEFERGEAPSVTIGSTPWDASRAGLLSGEGLLIDLQNLERQFIETNYRTMEIDQSFSLAQINPGALIDLRENGSCSFNIPEFFFDIFYPGQYQRKIKAVRITIPCVTGPYVNVGATLTLSGSQIRNEPKVDSGLIDVPLSRSVSIATSKAQNDAGVFEFNFRDERYMPFEGAGAVSSWTLKLPQNFRQFDYQTISDVVLHINYTAEEDEMFRNQLENNLSYFQDYLSQQFRNQSVDLTQVFSLRSDFSNEFYQIIHDPTKSPITINIKDRIPLFLNELVSAIKVKNAKIILRTAEDPTTGKNYTTNNFQISIKDTKNSVTLSNFLDFSDSIKLPSATISLSTIPDTLDFEIINPGDLASDSTTPDVLTIDSDKLLDIMLYLEYSLSETKN